MSALSIQVPFPVFQDRDGQPLDNGYVWIGTANLYPITNPVVAYFDEALTIIAAQPLRTINGYISNSGTPAQVFVDAVNFSILVQDSKGSMVYNFPDGTGISPDACGVTYDPPFTGAVAYPVCEKLEQTLSVKDFGAVADGITNDTAAIQAAIDAAKTNNQILYVTSGTYLISGLVIYPASYLTFDPNATLKMSGDGIAIRTVQSIGALAPTSRIDGIILENPTIDMNNYNGCGILLECARDSLVTSPHVYNIGTGTVSRNDTFSTDTYPTMGIGIKGITNISTAVFNRIVLARCMGVDTGSTPTGGVGIWLGGSQSGTSERANVNRIEQPICKDLLYGIHVDFGSDNIISQPEVSTCDDGIRVGRITGGAASSFRNRIVSPYVEESNTGVFLNFRSQNTFVDGLGSTSATVNPIFDNGVKTSLFTPNDDYEANFACFYKDRVDTTAVLFPATQMPSGDVNALDDYQEGTTTAVKVADATSGGNEATTSSTVCRFIKIGKMVTVWASFTNITTTSMTAGNQVFITGLPFTCVASNDWRPPVLVHFGAITTSAGNINGYINEGESYIRLFDMTTSGSAALLVSALSSGTADLYTQVTYEANA